MAVLRARRHTPLLGILLAACATRPHDVPHPRSRECRHPARTAERHAWSETRRRDLETALLPLVADDLTATRISRRLDVLAATWARGRGDACTAAGEDLPARAACQNDVLTGFDALVTRLQTDPASLTHADAGVDELHADLLRCERPTVLALYRAPEGRGLLRRLAVADLARSFADGRAMHAALRPAPPRPQDPRVRIALAWGTWLQGQVPDLPPDADADPTARAELATLRLFTRPDDERAEPEVAAAIAAVTAAYGPLDPRRAEVHHEHARRLRRAGAVVEALAAETSAVVILLSRRDPHDSPRLADLLHAQGELEHLLGDYQSAKLRHHEALRLRRALFGERHLQVAESQHDLANSLEALGDLQSAIALYTSAAELLQTKRPDDPLTASTYNNLGRALYAARSFTDARRFHSAALEIRQRHLGREHPDTATSLNNLGAVARAEGDLASALELFLESLKIRERILEPDHPYIAISLNNVAEVLAAEGKRDEAIALHERALAIRRARFGAEHPETARSQHNLGVLRLLSGDRESAEKLLSTAAATRAARLGPEHPETRSSLEQLRRLHGEATQETADDPIPLRAR